jgi:HD superfamily phosphodiesterase
MVLEMNFKKALSCMEQTGAIERFQKYSKAIKPEHFHRPHGIHGIDHTKRVIFFVELLASLENLDEPERNILSIAAVYHDIGRTNDGVDPTHGYASFMKAKQMDLMKAEIPEDYNAVKYLIETHCINDKDAFSLVRDYAVNEPDRAKRLLMVFKDADGLDRVRINDLNPAMLRLPVSRGLVQIAEELLLIPDVNTLFSAT